MDEGDWDDLGCHRISGGKGIAVSRTAGGLSIDAPAPQGLSARLTGSSGASYSWVEVYYDIGSSSWLDVGDGRSGTTSVGWAQERSGSTTIATGTRCWLTLDPSGEFYLFDAPAAGGATLLTTKGDLLTFDTAAVRLPVGADTYVLVADSAQAKGVKWGSGSLTVTAGSGLAGGGSVALGGTVTVSIATGGVTNAMLAGSIAASKLVGTDIATVGTITAGTWQGGVIAGAYGGTGVANTGKTITLGGNLTTSGAFGLTVAVTATTSVTLPTSGTLVGSNDTGTVTNTMLAGSIAASKLVGTDIATVGTLTAGSTGTGFTLAFGSSTLTGSVPVLNGGTGATTASAARTNLGVAIGTNVQAYSSTLDTVTAGTYTGASSITTLGTVGTGTWQGSVVAGAYGGTGVANAGKTITLGGNISTAGALTTSGAFGITLTATATTSVTLPTSGTLVGSADSGTVTNTMIASGVDASKLTTGTLPAARIAAQSLGGTLLASPRGVVTVTASSNTYTCDLTAGNIFLCTLAATNTIALSNEASGTVFAICLKQDGTGSRTVTWFSGISWAGGSAPTLTTTANKTDVFVFVRTAANTYLGMVAGQNC